MQTQKPVSLNIRKANSGDIPQILAITKRAFAEYQESLGQSAPKTTALSETPEDIMRDLTKHHIYVAEENGVILGSIRFMKLSAELAYIFRFGVEPDTKNIGVGSELLQAVITECTAEGMKAIALHTNAKFFKLARYYYGRQFFVHSTSTEKGYIRALFVKELSDNTEYDLAPAKIL